MRAEDKSNEITAIPTLLSLIELKGSLITMDAAGAQTPIIAQIVAGGGDYIAALKGNQSTTHDAVRGFCLDADSAEFNGVEHCEHKSEDNDHGRHEDRRVVTMPVPDTLDVDDRWHNFNTMVMVERVRQVGANEPSRETSVYLCSVSYKSIDRIASAIRAHWRIENNLHWCLDVQFREDQCQIGEGFAPENLAMIRRFALQCFKRRTDVKTSLKWKAKASLIDTGFLITSLLAGLP